MDRFRFVVDSKVFQAVPHYRRRVVVGVRTRSANEEAIQAAVAHAQRLSARADGDQANGDREEQEVAAWRDAFARVGLNANKYRPSFDALARRAAAGRDLTHPDPLVNIGTVLSLAHRLPIGVHVLDTVSEELRLGPARGDELFPPFAGDAERVAPGEIIYHDAVAVLTRRWIWRQGRHGSVAPGVRLVAMNVDVLSTALANAEEEAVLAEAYRMLALAGVEPLDTVTLSQGSASGEVAVPGVAVHGRTGLAAPSTATA